MVASGVPSHLNALLRRPHGDPVVTLAVELLWNILDYCPDSLPVIASQGLWTYEDGVAQPPPPAGAEAAQAAAPPQGVGLPPISEMSLGPLAEESTMAAYSEPSYAAPQDGGGGGPDAAAGTEQPGAQEPDGGARASTTSTIDLTALSEQAAQLANTLTRLLKALVLEGRKTSEKELRNDVLVAINLLMDDNAFKVAFWAAGLFTTVAVISVCPENGDSSSVIRSYALTTDEHDFELKQLAWAAVAKGCELQDVLQLAQQFGLMNVLLMYQQLPGSPTVTRWMPDQRATLQSVALSKLYVLAALAPQAYLAAKGLAMTTALLQDGGSQDVHVEAALRHLHNLCGLLPSVTKELVQERMVTRLLDLAMEPRHSSQLRHFAVLLLARLCGDDAMGAEEARRWVRRAGGVQRLLGELAAVVAQHALLPSPYVISLLDAVWAAVVPDRKSQAMFLVEGGLDTLLSMLERSAKGYRPVLLSMVADILENPKSHEFFFEWESDADQRNACRLLVGLWRDEDAARGMSADGVLANAVRPLAGLQSRTTWLPSEEVAYGSLSASRRQELEVVSSGVQGDAMLCKIYAVFALVGFDAVRSQLDARDQAVLAFIEQFVKFKQGEVWMDMKEEFGAAGMKPTETDVERLESGIESAQELARRLQEAQEALVNSHMDVARQAEASMFESMRAQREIDDQIRRLGPDSVIRAAQPTWKDISEAKAKKEAMLRASLHMHSTAAHADQDGGDDRPAHFDTAAVSLPLPAFGTGPLPPQTISPVPGHEASSGSSGKFVVPSLALNRVKSQ